jgi:hypothetical protein
MQIYLPQFYGGNGLFIFVRVLSDTGSDLMTLFYNEAFDLGWQAALFPSGQILVMSVDGVVQRESISVMARVLGFVLSNWFVEDVVLRNYTGVESRLSGNNVRNQLYFGTAPESIRLRGAN